MEHRARHVLVHPSVANMREAAIHVPGRGHQIAAGERDQRTLTERERQAWGRPPSFRHLRGLSHPLVGGVKRTRGDLGEPCEDERRLAERAVDPIPDSPRRP